MPLRQFRTRINCAVNGDTVLVDSGTYFGSGNRDIDVHGRSILILSAYGSSKTVIDCQASQADPHRGFHFHSGEDSLCVIDGFTIRNGYAPSFGSSGNSYGGGILIDSSSAPEIRNCTIAECESETAGGGIACLRLSPARIVRCSVINNRCINPLNSLSGGLGGGIRFDSSNGVLLSTVVFQNEGNIGGVSCRYSDVKMDSCSILQNRAYPLSTFEPVQPGVAGGIHCFFF